MSEFKKPENKRLILQFVITGFIIGSILGLLEYYVRLPNDPQEFIPLIIRANLSGFFITLFLALYEIFIKEKLRKKAFIRIVLLRSIGYTLIISFVLIIINGFWNIISRGITFGAGVLDYISDKSYLINLVSILGLLVIVMSIFQISSLHRKGVLLEFILGKYHTPKEEHRIFCFVDLKGSTSIGEKLGSHKYGLFLRDYYSDITNALSRSEAEVYQYVGDEIVLTWPYKVGLKNNNAFNCFFEMKEIIEDLKPKYLDKYGCYPIFKAGLHGGKVTVTWVGEIKKEILFIGDVLNTTARIQERCNSLTKEFLVSGDLLTQQINLKDLKASFMEEVALRGKQKIIKLYSLEHT
jgi:adenylate cyclase